MRSVASSIEFDIELSAAEIVAIRRMLSGNKVKFEVLKDARLAVKVVVEVDDPKERDG